MSIFGTLNPKIVYDYQGVNEKTILLNRAVLINQSTPPKTNVHENKLKTERSIIYKGKYYEAALQVNLFKEADPIAMARELLELENKIVLFWKHRDGSPQRDQYGRPLQMLVESVTIAYLTSSQIYDIALIVLVSMDAIIYDTNPLTSSWGKNYGQYYGEGF